MPSVLLAPREAPPRHTVPVKLIYTLIRTHPFSILVPMHFRRVYLESFGYTLPDEIVTTTQLEQRLAPLYERLRLPEGRLELMTGIRERRFFPPGTRPSTISIESARRAIEASGIDRRNFGAHPRLGLPRFFGAGHCLPRASWRRIAERRDDLRHLERLPRLA